MKTSQKDKIGLNMKQQLLLIYWKLSVLMLTKKNRIKDFFIIERISVMTGKK